MHKAISAVAKGSQLANWIALGSLVGLLLHLVLAYWWRPAGELLGQPWALWPLFAVLLGGGLPLLLEILRRLARRELSADLLAGIAIVTALWLAQYLAASLVVLMLASGQALEAYAVRRASFALQALAKRLPLLAHCKRADAWVDLPLEQIGVGDEILLLPHEACPVDGVVLDGRSSMDESYLTGEPYVLAKVPGSLVLSGAINGEGALTIRAEQTAQASRYAKIMQVMRDAEQRRPQLRRLGDQLGALYTPLAVAIALLAWALSGEVLRFLAVLVVATPCPLLIAIPVSIISSVSLAARRGIIIRDPAVLEKIDTCRVAIFDKTGTLTCGQPSLTEVLPAPGFSANQVLLALASLERYSRHPLAGAILSAAQTAGLELLEASAVSERPGQGLRGVINGQPVQVTSRKQLLLQLPAAAALLAPSADGLECIVLLAGQYAGACRFHDAPRAEGKSFINHLMPLHGFERLLLVSGDRESEVRYLAAQVGIDEVYASQSPEQKLALIRAETLRANTVFVGDGINDAPALTAATVGIAFGQASDVTAEAAGAVILDSSLQRVDELLHIGRRMRRIALQSALGGMALSLVGMGLAAAGYLSPVAGAVAQEVIDALAILNALRAAIPPRSLSDY
ncbi:MAG: cadmium-translocating P-type ATPase [Pseudomonadaceae bacterium]|nr:cadmium-translocating P-type ATPase [Pseudomonadaceae bacterium]